MFVHFTHGRCSSLFKSQDSTGFSRQSRICLWAERCNTLSNPHISLCSLCRIILKPVNDPTYRGIYPVPVFLCFICLTSAYNNESYVGGRLNLEFAIILKQSVYFFFIWGEVCFSKYNKECYIRRRLTEKKKLSPIFRKKLITRSCISSTFYAT